MPVPGELPPPVVPDVLGVLLGLVAAGLVALGELVDGRLVPMELLPPIVLLEPLLPIELPDPLLLPIELLEPLLPIVPLLPPMLPQAVASAATRQTPSRAGTRAYFLVNIGNS